jgi:Fungalysin metallopeptidase (M36)
LQRWGTAGVVAGAALLGGLALACPAGSAADSGVDRELRAATAPVRELSGAAPITLPGGAVVHRYQQRVGGRPVIGAEAIVNDAPGAAPLLVADSTRGAIESPAPARVTRDQAIQIASDRLGVIRLRGQVSSALAIRPGLGGTLVWRVLIPAARPLGDFEFLVDAATGRVLSRHNLLEYYQRGKAKLYNPNPVVEHHGARGLHKDHHGKDTPLLRKLRRKVPIPNLDDGQDCLRGRWVHALRGRKKKKETCNPNLNWSRATRSDSRFDALMVYFHINRAQAYIQQLGFSNSNSTPNGINDRVQLAVANAFRADNSFYSPASGVIKYGSGGVDDAEDGDVILHEYGHAMQDSQSAAFGHASGFQAGSLAEGSSDYWAAAMSSLVPHTANEDDVCIFDWDATTYGKFYPRVPPERSGRRCGRRADLGRTLQKAQKGTCGTDVHCVGQVWASALWDLRRTFVAKRRASGGARMDRIYLASQFLYTSVVRFKGAAKALLCADEDLYPHGRPGDCRGEDYSAIHREMRERGILR